MRIPAELRECVCQQEPGIVSRGIQAIYNLPTGYGLYCHLQAFSRLPSTMNRMCESIPHTQLHLAKMMCYINLPGSSMLFTTIAVESPQWLLLAVDLHRQRSLVSEV